MLALTLTLTLALARAGSPMAANAHCPVTGADVTNHLLYHHVTVKGRVFYVSDRTAARKLKSCPSCYLAPDGTPLNELPPSAGAALRAK